MTTSSDDLVLFDSVLLEAVADEKDLDVRELATLAGDHQANVERLPGVENLVYEWRKQYRSPLIDRTDATPTPPVEQTYVALDRTVEAHFDEGR